MFKVQWEIKEYSCCKFLAESSSEIIVKIAQHLPKLGYAQKLSCMFFELRCVLASNLIYTASQKSMSLNLC